MLSHTSNEERLEDVLATCVAELFADMQIKAERVNGDYAPPPLPDSLTAFCGFGSADLRGSITLLGSVALFSQIHPLPIDVTPRDLADWACEIVNQAVGRYRNRLLQYNLSLALGVPQSALAERVRLWSSLRSGNRPICFTIGRETLEIWLELVVKPGFCVAERSPNESTAGIVEGSMLFF
ncbi:MAG: hypothetical protein ABSB49_04820 [Polyangia bacterium]